MPSVFIEDIVFHDYVHQFGYNLSAGYAHFYPYFSQNMGRDRKGCVYRFICSILMVYFPGVILRQSFLCFTICIVL